MDKCAEALHIPKVTPWSLAVFLALEMPLSLFDRPKFPKGPFNF